MNANVDMPALNFFRATPPELLANPPLASSLQAFETSLFLIAIDRYPSALVSCGSAWESAIKAKFGIPPEDKVRAADLVKRAQSSSVALNAFDTDALREFREKRNSVAHYGFSPKDDEECVLLLLKTGFPFLSQLYREMFNFFLDWRDIRLDAANFMDLSPTEAAKAGLLPDVAEQMRMATGIYARAKDLRGQNYRYCFRGLAQYVRLGMKGATMSEAEWAVAEDSATGSSRYAAEREVKERLKQVLDHPTWEFDCPICNGVGSVVTELDDAQLDLRNIVTGRCACVACGFFAREGEPYLSGAVLERQIASSAPAIFKELGIDG